LMNFKYNYIINQNIRKIFPKCLAETQLNYLRERLIDFKFNISKEFFFIDEDEYLYKLDINFKIIIQMDLDIYIYCQIEKRYDGNLIIFDVNSGDIKYYCDKFKNDFSININRNTSIYDLIILNKNDIIKPEKQLELHINLKNLFNDKYLTNNIKFYNVSVKVDEIIKFNHKKFLIAQRIGLVILIF